MSQVEPAKRFVELEGCHNFRDLGGYATGDARRVRRGLLYRSDGLHELTQTDVKRLREQLGLRAIVDLRTDTEAESEGPGRLAEPPVTYHHVPLLIRAGEFEPLAPDQPFELDRFYFGLMLHGAGRVRRVVEVLSHASGAAVFHCAAGKDRTGVISAVILALLGVPDETIIDDYALTRHGLADIRSRLLRSAAYRDMFRELPRESLSAAPEIMSALLRRVRERWGSVSGYADAIEIPAESVARLRDRLLEDL